MNIFGYFLIFTGFFGIFSGQSNAFLLGPTLILIGVVLTPIFDKLLLITERQFSKKRKTVLGVVTFLIPGLFVQQSTIDIAEILVSAILTFVFWFIMFLTSPKSLPNSKNEGFLEKIKKNFFGKQIKNKSSDKSYENKVKVNESFSKLSILSYNAMSKMLSETHNAYVNVVEHDYLEVELFPIITDFCIGISDLYSENELECYFSDEFYYKMIKKHFSDVLKYMRRVIYSSSNDYLKSNQYLNNKMKVLSEGISLMSDAKFFRTVFNYNKYSSSELSSSFSYNLRDDITYIVDVLSTCTCIAKLLFFENAACSLNDSSEFYKIISNLVSEFNDINLIIKKSRPLYDEFYTKYLFSINKDIYYDITIAILANHIKYKKFSNEQLELLEVGEKRFSNLSEFDSNMDNWIKKITSDVNNRNLDIYSLLVQRTVLSIDSSNTLILFNALAHVSSYVDLYNRYVSSNNKYDDKERYLKGDFKKEQNEVNAKYVLNNIASGTQFELFLTNLFRDLGYKVKHTGKAGDQGADLIIMKNNFVYAVQAKFYTGKLSNTPVQEIVGALKYYNANQGVVITNSSFTTGAESLAKSNDVILIDGKELRKLMELSFDEKNQSRDVLSDFNK